MEEPTQLGNCEGGCRLEAYALRCPGSVSEIEVSGPNLLVEYAGGADLFRRDVQDGFLAVRRWQDTAPRRELAADEYELPIVVHELAEGTLSVRPGSPVDDDVEIAMSPLLGTRYVDGSLHILGNTSSGLTLWSFAEDGSSESTVVSEKSSQGVLVTGSSPPRVLYNLNGNALWSYERDESAPVMSSSTARAMPRYLSAVAIGEREILAYQPTSSVASGAVEVNDAGTVSLVGVPRTLECPADYVAEYPDICEFEPVTPETTSGAVLASDLVVYQSEPWLVTIVADVTDRCDTNAGRCFETLPCDCQYQRRGGAVRSELRLTALDSARTYSLRLRDFPYETVSVVASSSDAGKMVIAVAERQFTAQGSDAGTAIDFVMLSRATLEE